MRFLWGILLPALLLGYNPVYGKKDEPAVYRHEFEDEPAGLFYFDDTETVILIEANRRVVWRSENAGQEWKVVDDIPKSEVYTVMPSPHDNRVAVALGTKKQHWITYDQGKSWKKFETEGHPSYGSPVQFHASDPKKLLFSGSDNCDWTQCLGKTWYTEDGFEKMKLLRENRKMCIFAKTNDLFSTGDEKLDDKRIMCIVPGKYGSSKSTDYRMVISDNFFEDEHEATMSDGRAVAGMANMAAVKAWIVAAAKGEGTDELALYISKDTKQWHKAEFTDHKIEEDAYTILESTNYSIQVDVMTSKYTEMGSLFTSNSNGTYFTRNIEHTNRNREGFVDFEKMSNVQGVVLVNIVENFKDVDRMLAYKKVKSQISFDDGRTFESLKTGDKELHLHSVTELRNSGRVFSSPAPGLVMGVGNTGDYLDEYTKGDLYVSDDGGLTWTKALEDAHKYEFGDQGAVLVAVYDEGPTKEIRYSLKHGKGDWGTIKLENEFLVGELTTIPDSTSLRFIITAREGKGKDAKYATYSLNFEEMHEGKCGKDDFEEWHARLDGDGKATCVMGRKQSYRRRKADADCFVEEEFKDPEPKWDVCACSDADYECDFNFVPEGSGKDKKCVPARGLTPPDGTCKDPGDKFKGPSGWRIIPGNQCDPKAKDAVRKDEPQEWKCSDLNNPVASGKITTQVRTFPAGQFREYYYLERAPEASGTDETIVMLSSERKAYITHDHGKNWKEAVDDEVVAIYPHQYYNDAAFFVTPKSKVHYTYDRGQAIHSFEAPEAPNTERLQILSFHPKPSNKDWLVWTGEKDGRTVSHVSTRGGLEGSWKPLLPSVRKCQFIWREENRNVKEELVYCEQFADEDPKNQLQLLSSDDWFDHKKVEFEDVVSFATMSEFIVIASKTEDRKWLKLDASIDGKTFADAKFPPKFGVDHQQAYTVLDSSTHSVFLHVTVNGREEQEYGSIIKSNSNGTSYVLSIQHVNRNTDGYVDFEKMQGLEGVALINIVSNHEAVDKGEKKKKKTLITHNDGAEWDLIPPPKGSDCSGGIDKCSLHLHGYTERSDPRNTFSSPTAVGIMMGVGNVGEYLGRAEDGNTYLTKDGGITWHEAMKGVYMWEFGDQGSIIVIIQRHTATNEILYSLDEGDNWTKYQFHDSKMQIDQISTVPSDTSMNFLLWGVDTANPKEVVTVNLDFSGMFTRQCKLDDNDPLSGDYDLWSPKHPKQDDDCLFGHVAQFHRKKPESKECFNGKRIDHLHSIARNCSCTRQDFECDYNFERQSDGNCVLLAGLKPMDSAEACAADPTLDEYWDPSGYRKIPISTCEGGTDYRRYGVQPHPCKNHEDQFSKKHGANGFVIFLAVVLSIGAAGGIGYYVHQNWDGKFGRIRLGDSTGYSALDGDQPWVKYPVLAVSGVVAIIGAIPLVLGALWRFASERMGGRSGYGGRTYNSRSSFARGRGDYAVVDPMDEGELLGDDSDEEV